MLSLSHHVIVKDVYIPTMCVTYRSHLCIKQKTCCEFLFKNNSCRKDVINSESLGRESRNLFTCCLLGSYNPQSTGLICETVSACQGQDREGKEKKKKVERVVPWQGQWNFLLVPRRQAYFLSGPVVPGQLWPGQANQFWTKTWP